MNEESGNDLYYTTIYTTDFVKMCLERNMTIINTTQFTTFSDIPAF